MTITELNGHEALQPGKTPDILLAEKAVLGTILDSRKAAETVIEILPAEDCFADATHRAVYAAVRYLTESGEPLDPAAVLARLVAAEQGIWKTGQAGVILGGLIRHATPSYAAHARTVLTAAVRRRALVALDQAGQILADPEFDPEASGDIIRGLLDGALEPGAAAPDVVTAADLFTSAVERLEAGTPPGVVQMPYADLRDLIPWLRPGQLVTIAARPTYGKSLLGQDLARYAGLHKQIPAILFTMEMDRDEVMDRFLSAESGVLLDHITDNALTDHDWERIAATSERFAESKLVIDDTARLTLAHMRARLRGMARREAAQVAIVDYLQLMTSTAGENRQREVSELVAGLKAVAREFRIPVVMLCQLNRGPETRHDKRPHMSDARESGSVENDSDVVILIHRPDMHDPESPRAGETDLIIDKHRNGRRGTVTIGFQGHYGRFVDLAWKPSAVLEKS